MSNKFSSVGERILTRLQEKNMKQADLCRETGISSNAISQYVTGKRTPDTASLYKISSVLCVSMEWLLAGTHTPNENTSNESLICDGTPLSQNEMDLVAMYRFLNAPDKKIVFDVAKMEYDQATGEKVSIYSTYSDTKEPQNGGPQNMSNTGSGIA